MKGTGTKRSGEMAIDSSIPSMYICYLNEAGKLPMKTTGHLVGEAV